VNQTIKNNFWRFNFLPRLASSPTRLEAKIQGQWQDIFDCLVVFTGAPDQSITFEPITQATKAFNLVANGIENTRHCVLEPNESLFGDIWRESNP
jgi:hypothetical protein